MPSPSVLFAFLATCMGYVSLVLLAICIACGLYCASELAEEYSSLALRVVKVAFATVLGLHALMLVAGVDLFTIAVSVGCHVCYASLLAKFPYVDPCSFPVCLSCLSAFLNQYFWFQFFVRFGPVPLLQTSGFFVVMTWSIPMLLFVSLSVDELPSRAIGLGEGGGDGYGGGEGKNGGRGKKNIFHNFSDKVMENVGGFIRANAPGGIKKAF